MISVIVPVYNAEKTLMDCVRSILEQTYPGYELILVNDGSSDHSGYLCDEVLKYCNAREVRCQVIHKQNGGVSSARNCAMEQANGEFFVCVDSDDVVEPCYLEDFVRTAREHPEFGHVLCGFRCTSHVHNYILSEREPLSVLDRREYMRLYDAILIQGPCLGLYRTELVRSNHLKMREDMSLAEDTLFNLAYLDVLDRTTIGVINKTNYIYHNDDPGSLNRKYRQDLLPIYEEVEQHLKAALEKWGVTSEKDWKRYYNVVVFQHLKAMNNTFHPSNLMTFSEKIAFNNTIMQEKTFREALGNCTVTITPARRKAYLSGDYKRVLMLDRIDKAKQSVRRLLKNT